MPGAAVTAGIEAMTQLLVAQPSQLGVLGGRGGQGGRVRGQATPVTRLGQQAPCLRMADEEVGDQSTGFVGTGGHTQQSMLAPRPDIGVRSGAARPR